MTEYRDFPLDRGTGPPDAGLAGLAEQAASCNPACCGATATVVARDAGHGEPPPTAVTHPDLAPLVSVQWESGEGPIPSALETGRPASAEDLLRDERWPGYRAKALDAGVRASVTVPFRRQDLAVTLTVYGFRPGFLRDAAHGATVLLGDLATTGLLRDRHYREVLAEVDQLDTALRTRPVVDQACGIVMYVLRCDADTAMTLLRRLSQRTNRKLSDLAEALVRTRGHGLEAQLARLAEQLGRTPGAAAEPTLGHGRAARRAEHGALSQRRSPEPVSPFPEEHLS
ncbi:ANTAR domain-containing protein [Streptomyces sp. NPDC004647]|uniref:ANTAR domain-containing response regulator n=1 Tax=Streptomyces sp. NPDC004647 TaxID=3154671 RepID=UPI0033BCC5CE